MIPQSVLAAGQHRSPSHAANLALTRLQVKQENILKTTKPNKTHPTTPQSQSHSTLPPSEVLGSEAREGADTSAPGAGQEGDEGPHCPGQAGMRRDAKEHPCREPSFLRPSQGWRPQIASWWLCPDSSVSPAGMGTGVPIRWAKGTGSFLVSPPCSLLTEPGHDFKLIRLPLQAFPSVKTPASRVLQGTHFWKEKRGLMKGVFFS